MSAETLRDRIIRAIQLSNTVVYPNEWHPIADSIIRELGLKQDRAVEDRGGSKRKVTRYVSDWRTDDE